MGGERAPTWPRKNDGRGGDGALPKANSVGPTKVPKITLLSQAIAEDAGNLRGRYIPVDPDFVAPTIGYAIGEQG